MDFYLTGNSGVRNMQETLTFGMFTFSHNFSVLSKLTIPISWDLGIVWISFSSKMCQKQLTLECSVFSFRYYWKYFPNVSVTILLMWETMENFYLWAHFHTNVSVKLFTKEVNLFCSWARPILNPFVIEVWKYIQYGRVGSVFYGGDSIEMFLWIWQLEFV